MATVITPRDARELALPGRRSRAIASGEADADNVSLRLVEIDPVKPGEAQRGPHVHRGFAECIYVLSGSGVTESDSGEHALEAGDTILIPAGEVHVTRASGVETLRLLCFFPTGDVAMGTTEFASWGEAGGQR
jgi:quercetin dioxygenase-like cupin family protein